MAGVAFFIPLQITLVANAQGTLSYVVPTNETLRIKAIRQKSTGAFDIMDIRDSQGNQYSSATASSPIDSDFIQDVATANIAMSALLTELIIKGGGQIQIEVKDTSGAGNLVEVLLECVKE